MNYFKWVSYFMLFLWIAGCSKKEQAQNQAQINIQGSIEIAPDLQKFAQASDVIFLIARPATGGPPLAVKKFTGNQYPYAFTLTDQDLMIPQQVVDVPINLSVRVDKDGDALSKNPDDLIGQYDENPISLVAKDVTVRITQKIE